MSNGCDIKKVKWLHVITVTWIALSLCTAANASDSAFSATLDPQDVFSRDLADDDVVEPRTESNASALNTTAVSFQTIDDVPTQDAFRAASCSSCGPCGYELLPASLLYRSYIAAPHEPRMATIALYDSGTKSWRWDSTLGGRVGLFRRYRPPRMNLDAWQIDLEGAVMVRLNPEQKMDLESSDYRFGLQWTGKRDNLTYKFGYFHISSHVGDEFLVRNPTFERINYVRESLVAGTAWQATPEWRLYGEAVWGFIATGGADPFQIQYGAEYSRIAPNPVRGAPFAAINLQHEQEDNFSPGVNVLSGWQWRGPQSGRSFRIGLQYFTGPSNQYQFFTRYDNQFGLGVWFDY